MFRTFADNIIPKLDFAIFFGMSSVDKRNLIQFLNRKLEVVTLAIGDGHNDAEMVKEARIGVCIKTSDGTYTQQVCDYLIPDFKDLGRLLFVHGRWAYLRICDLILILFFRNVLFTVPQVMFCFYNGYSMTSLYTEWQMIYFNLFITAIPVVARAIFDKDIYFVRWMKGKDKLSKKASIEVAYNLRYYYPYLYYEGKGSERLSVLSVLLWILEALLMGGFFFFILIQSIEESAIDVYGSMADLWFMSITMYFITVFVVDIKLGVYTQTWTWINFIALFVFSVVLLLGFTWISDLFTNLMTYNTAVTVFSSGIFYLNLLYACGASFIYFKLILITQKEISPKLSLLFGSILRLRKEQDTKLFEDTVKAFNLRRRTRTPATTTSAPSDPNTDTLIANYAASSQKNKNNLDQDASNANLLANQSAMAGNSSFY